jgi:uncharacterized protein (DUF1800 family)
MPLHRGIGYKHAMNLQSAVAAIRFGLGPRPDDQVPADPAAWLDRQIGRAAPQRVLPGFPPPLSLAQAAALNRQMRTQDRGDVAGQRAVRRASRNASEREVIGWIGHCLLSDAPFQDRLTNFWANHFTVSRRLRRAGIYVGPLIRDVIRPTMFGRFEDMLIGAVRQPGMLIYLSNGRSTGPNSPAAQRGPAGGAPRGLNENLAREILELQTVSPAAGYSQADVTEFARILTGWGIDQDEGEAGFRFRATQHEPGPKTLLGRRFPEGEQGGIEALRFLAHHPATHRHLATKLARHFVADDPPREAIARLEAVLRDTGGDLGAVSRALVRLPQAWSPPLTKVRDPLDYVLAVGRSLGLGAEQAESLAQAVEDFGQPLWSAPQPNGWPDVAEEWAVPEALLNRIQWAHAMAGRAAQRRDAAQFAAASLGPLAAGDTLREAARAGSPQDALTLVLVSPEFLRR